HVIHGLAHDLSEGRPLERVAEGARQGGDRALVQAPPARDLEDAGEQRRRGAAEEPIAEPDGEVAGRPRRELRGGPPAQGARERAGAEEHAQREASLAGTHLPQTTHGSSRPRGPRYSGRDGRSSRLCLTSHTPRGVSRTAGRKSAERKKRVNRGSWCG